MHKYEEKVAKLTTFAKNRSETVTSGTNKLFQIYGGDSPNKNENLRFVIKELYSVDNVESDEFRTIAQRLLDRINEKSIDGLLDILYRMMETRARIEAKNGSDPAQPVPSLSSSQKPP